MHSRKDNYQASLRYNEYMNDYYIRMDYRKLYLNVSFRDKDYVKSLGAKWDPTKRKWFIEDTYSFHLFSEWFHNPDSNIIVFDELYVVETMRRCFKCKSITPVICLASENFVHVIEEVYQDYNDFPYGHSGLIDNEMYFIYGMKDLPDYLSQLLKERFNFYYGYSKTIDSSYYGNHCAHCGTLQGDYYLFNGEDAPFNISTEDRAKEVTLHKIKLPEPLELYNTMFSKTSEDYLLENFSIQKRLDFNELTNTD